ncbi:hypothetical protein ScPMuIL_004810 [Solemya velum]
MPTALSDIFGIMASAPSLFSGIHDPSEKVREMCKYACNVEVDQSIPPRRYLRSGQEVLRMATVYHEEGDLESAFILYSKFLSLFVEKLPRHPDYLSAPATEINKLKKKVKQVFPLAEDIKNKLKKRYTEEEKKYQEEQRKKQEELEREQDKIRKEEEERRKILAEQEERDRRDAETLWLQEQEDKLKELKERELQKNLLHDREGDDGILISVLPDDASLNNRSTKSASGHLQFIPNDLSDPNRPRVEKNWGVNDSLTPQIPDREFKKNLVIGENKPKVDRGTKPAADHWTCTGVTSGNKHGLKTVIVPSDLMHHFLVLAQPNTSRNVETCGILAGKLAQNTFHITHVLIPKQSGTSDTCSTENEEDIFDYQDNHNLITLGWIHTHPSQTAFLSSVDLHTHCPYQLMMPEAIAIVCSPKHGQTGIFTMTVEKGLPLVSQCRQSGFHVHPSEPPLFENCSHVQLVDNEKITVADLRSRS